jgi:transposase
LFGEDERDAADLADLLRMGRLPEAWIAPPEIRELRELTRYRHKLAGLRTSCRDQVHAVLAKLGIRVTGSDIFGTSGQAWLDGLDLPQPFAGKVASLRQLNGELTGEIVLLEQVIGDLLAGHEGYRAIQALPGIGPVLGAVIVAEIGDIRRFPGAGQLCSWPGLTPRHMDRRQRNTPRCCGGPHPRARRPAGRRPRGGGEAGPGARVPALALRLPCAPAPAA